MIKLLGATFSFVILVLALLVFAPVAFWAMHNLPMWLLLFIAAGTGVRSKLASGH